MAEEEKNENVEETPEAEAPPETAEAEAAAETPEAEVPAETPEPEAAEATPAEDAPPAEAATAPSAPAETLSPKERRRRARAEAAAKVPARPPASPEERQEQRVAERRQKAELRRAGRAHARAKERADTTPSKEVSAREHVPGVQKIRQGVVVSDRADKTITIRVDTTRRHRQYAKVVRTSRTLHAHDERNDAHIGDTVVVREARPLSRTKRWRLVEVLERAK